MTRYSVALLLCSFLTGCDVALLGEPLDGAGVDQAGVSDAASSSTDAASADAASVPSGQSCITGCDGTSLCQSGLYCPDSCQQCPCPGTCTAQFFACTIGNDLTCNVDSGLAVPHGTCAAPTAKNSPVGSFCTCNAGSTLDPVTGKCT